MRPLRHMLGALTIVLIGVPPAQAEVITMACNNGVHDFQAKWDSTRRAFFENDTRYTVLAVEKNTRAYTITGLTLNGGPTFRAMLRPQKKIDYFVDNKLSQTDRCH